MPRTCDEIFKTKPKSADGLYIIDPDGPDALPQVEVSGPLFYLWSHGYVAGIFCHCLIYANKNNNETHIYQIPNAGTL